MAAGGTISRWETISLCMVVWPVGNSLTSTAFTASAAAPPNAANAPQLNSVGRRMTSVPTKPLNTAIAASQVSFSLKMTTASSITISGAR